MVVDLQITQAGANRLRSPRILDFDPNDFNVTGYEATGRASIKLAINIRDWLLTNGHNPDNPLGFEGTVFPEAHGAIGDDATDDQEAIQEAIDVAVALRRRLRLEQDYAVLSPVTIHGRLEVDGPGKIHQLTTGQPVVLVTASNVRIRQITVQGPQSAIANNAEFGIKVEAPSWAEKLTNVKLDDVTVYNCGGELLRMKWVDGWEVNSATLTDGKYAGFLGWGCRNGRFIKTDVRRITGTAGNSYGATVTKGNGALDVDPISENICFENCNFEDIPNWNGIDTHGGSNISILNNTFSRVRAPIWAVPASLGSTETWAPHNITVMGNVMDSGVDDGSAEVAIVFSGAASAVGAVVDYATGCVAQGNSIRRYGNQAASTSGGIQLEFTKGAIIQANPMRECSPNGVVLKSDNIGFAVDTITATDCWSNTFLARLIRVEASNQSGTISNCHLIAGTKSGVTHLNENGLIVVTGAANIVLRLRNNNFDAATSTQIIDQPGGSIVALANADTSGAVLGDLEAEVNQIKAALRSAGIIAT